MKRNGARNQRQIAKKWGVSVLTVQNWVKRGLPVQDDKALAESLSRGWTSNKVRVRAIDILKGYAGEEEKEPEAVVEAELKARKTALDVVSDLERNIAYYNQQLEQGKRTANQAMVENAIKQHGNLALTLIRVRKELHKMGEESGNTIAKAECVRILKAIGSRASVAIGRLKEVLGKAVVGAATVEDAANRVEPELVRGLFFEPFRAAGLVAANCGLPGWVVEALRETVGDYVEEGEKEFDAPHINPELG